MPRLKGISKQKLFKAEIGQSFPNLDPVMALRAINWELIEEQLDTMAAGVKVVVTCPEAKPLV
jgi:TnpA family transposase